MSKIIRNSIPLVMVTLVVCVGCTVDPPHEYDPDPARRLESVAVGGADKPVHTAIVSTDTERHVPTMVWTERNPSFLRPLHDTPEAAARRYLEQYASMYRLSRADLQATYVHRIHDIGRGGIIALFRQRVAGMDVVHNELKVLMTRELELVALTGSLHDGMERAQAEAGGQSLQATFRHSPAEAVLSALGDLYGLSLAGNIHPVGISHTGLQLFDLVPSSTGGHAGISLVTPARVMPIYFPASDRLVPAYSVEILAERVGDEHRRGYAYVTDAGNGQVLHRRNRIANEAYSYQVWAEADGTPRDGPQEDYTPHPTGVPDGNEPAFVPPNQIAMEGLVHPDGKVDPWLPAGATTTTGNNVHAYADHYDPDGFTAGVDPQACVPPGNHDFHYTYDTSLGPLANETQAYAATTQLFYTTNWLHDYFYQSGFDERAGNAQDTNYGRGGVGGDALFAEAQNLGPDPRERNNALIYTPPDGMSPQMELSLWEVPEKRSFTVAGTRYTTGKAEFGTQNFERAGALVLADDGVASSSDGCQPLQNDVTGGIVLVDRGNCLYELKAVHAENAKAAGLIIINHVPGDPPPDMFDVDHSLNTTLPVLSVSYEDGQVLKGMLASEPTEGIMARTTSIERDGTIDNTIVAHEWGHLLHHRLVECSTAQCRAQSEGWGDFTALHMIVHAGDHPDGTYGIASYAAHLLGESAYYGIRRVPYSRDPAKNALRFRHIANDEPLPGQHPIRDNGVENSEIHNAGEVWAAMLFDGYLALIDETKGASPRIASFDEAKRRMADYVVAGMVLAPADPTFTEQRDALLMATQARDSQDMLLLARAFAARGAGTCAVSPQRKSTNFKGIVEDYELRPNIQLKIMQFNDDSLSCDRDGVLDAEETGYIKFEVSNLGPVPLTDATLQVSANTEALSFPEGTKFDLNDVAPFSSATLQIPLKLDPSLSTQLDVDIDVVLTSSQACQASVRQRQSMKFNYDLAPSRSDSVEGQKTAWTTTVLKGGPAQAWQIISSPRDEREHVWYAADGFDFADTVLETPLLEVSADENFIMTFDHRYSFAHRLNPLTGLMDYWNGGAIEISRDNGMTWMDVRPYAEPGYGGVIAKSTGNPLDSRLAYVAKNPSWPMPDVATLNFGTTLSGETVKLRFHLGSAWYFEAYGWEIDNISIQGTSNTPFLDIKNDTGSCSPLASAGKDQTGSSGDVIVLDGSRSSDPNGDALTYSWEQRAGPTVSLQGDDPVHPHFTAPTVADDTLLTFDLHVTDLNFTGTDTVNILIHPRLDPPHPPLDGGVVECGCASLSTGDASGRSSGLWLLVGMLAAHSASAKTRMKPTSTRPERDQSGPSPQKEG